MLEMKKYNGGELPKRDLVVYTKNGLFSIFYREGRYFPFASFNHPEGRMQSFNLRNNKVLAYCDAFVPIIKDTMRTHNGFTFEWEEADGDIGYVASPERPELFYFCDNESESNHVKNLKSRKLVSRTPEQAISLAKAMIGIDPNGE